MGSATSQASHKTARVIRAVAHGADVRWLALSADEPLGFVGGQFLSIHTGRTNADGKPIRRAYSLLSSDRDQLRFEIASKRIPCGPGSGFVRDLACGDEVRFTGPWGTFFPAPDAGGETLVLATDTGVTAALGMVQAQRFERLLAGTTFVWLRPSEAYFLPESLVRARIPTACARVCVDLLAPSDNPERVAHVQTMLSALLRTSRFSQAFISGDGRVNYALMGDLVAAGVPCTRDQLESFFHMPKKVL